MSSRTLMGPRAFVETASSSPLKNSSFSVGLHKLPGKASGSPRSCTYTGGSDNAARRFVGAERGVAVFQRAARYEVLTSPPLSFGS
ncbi:MAG: hypothetical protein ACI82F_004585 [Planctomycetota bacterium]|jgi:hypothetical protein